jgi:Zn-dependent M28 family amino/carboxypeptidase
MKLRLLPLTVLAGAGCSTPHAPVHDSSPSPRGIHEDQLRAHIAELSSDRYEGRGPGTPGEQLTVDYLRGRFEALGLEPGNPDGSWVQEVPMVAIRSTPTLSFVHGEERIALAAPAECVVFSRRIAPQGQTALDVDVKADEVLFVGYGIEAPQYHWNDYKDVDVRGKLLIMLVNDPPVPDPRDPTALDENVFGGKAMTLYGRWTYKYEIAAKKKAAGVLLVHEDAAAGYPFGVVQASWGRENFDLAEPTDPANPRRAAAEGWIRNDKAKELFKAAGLDFEQLKAAAAKREFQPVALKDFKAELHVHNEQREVRSRNVIARLPGRDPARRGEYLVYSAHWDHLGMDPALPEQDKIYHGAVDNASGVAGLLEIAALFADPKSSASPRSILFLATTAEEKGLLGARWYVEHPLYPLEQTLCNINIDGLNPFGRTRDLVSIGLGQTNLDATLEELVQRKGRVLRGDSEPEKGYYYRSDHYEFASHGVPAVYADSGEELIGAPAGEGRRRREEYTRLRYHKPADRLDEDWNLEGAAEDLELLYELGREVSRSESWPAWRPSSEFRPLRAPRAPAQTAQK